MKKETLHRLIEQVINEAEIANLVATGDPDYLRQAIDLAVMLGDEEKGQVIEALLQLSSEDFLNVADAIMEVDEYFSVRQMMPIYDTVKYTLLSVFRKRRMPTITKNPNASPWLLEQAYLFLNRLHQKPAADRDMLYLAKNPATPVKVLKRLTTYSSAHVRKSAENNLANRTSLEEAPQKREALTYEGDDSILEHFKGATLEEGDLVCEGCLFEMLQEASCGCPDLVGEAEYQGRKVTLNKPTRGDVKKFKVYVKDPKTGNIKKVNFGHGGTSAKAKGEKTMKIRKNNPEARKSFRARHNCDNPGPKTKARYWSCKKW